MEELMEKSSPLRGEYMKIDLWNGQGYIELIDYAAMGNRTGAHRGDWAVVDGARVSFARRASEFDFEKNKELAEYLWGAMDMSPFSHCVFQFRVRVPVHIALYWFLFPHAEYSEMSGRYTKKVADLDNCFVPPDFDDDLGQLLVSDFQKSTEMYKRFYDPEKFQNGEKQVAKELARSALLYSFSTEFIFTITLRKLAHFLMFFADRDDFADIREAFLAVIDDFAPIFSQSFRQTLNNAPIWQHACEGVGFSSVERGVLGDDASAVGLWGVRCSDSDLCNAIRCSRPDIYDNRCLHPNTHMKGEYETLAALIRESGRDNLPSELNLVGMHLSISCPVYVFRQMYRHKRASWFGLRIRHHLFYRPREWRAQTSGSRYVFEPFSEAENRDFTDRFSDYVSEREERFDALIKDGVPITQAERFIPYCFYVEVFRNSDGIDLFNFFNLRCDWHAQEETRKYAMAALKYFSEHFPILFRVWYEEYFMGKNDERNQIVNDLYRSVKKQ